MSVACVQTVAFERRVINGVPFLVWPPNGENLRGYVPRPELEEEIALQLFDDQQHGATLVCLFGPPGTGKTWLAHAIAKRLGRELYKISGHDSLKTADLITMGRIKEDQTVEYVLSAFSSGVLNGGLVFLDDVDKLREETISGLLYLFDGASELLSETAGTSIPVQPAVKFLFGANQVSVLPPLFFERLFKIEVPFLPLDKTLEIVRQSGVIPNGDAVLEAFRSGWAQFTRHNGERPLSLRQVQRACLSLAKSARAQPRRLRDRVVQMFAIAGVVGPLPR